MLILILINKNGFLTATLPLRTFLMRLDKNWRAGCISQVYVRHLLDIFLFVKTWLLDRFLLSIVFLGLVFLLSSPHPVSSDFLRTQHMACWGMPNVLPIALWLSLYWCKIVFHLLSLVLLYRAITGHKQIMNFCDRLLVTKCRKIHSCENGTGLKMILNYPMSKEKLWKTCRKFGELLLETTLKNLKKKVWLLDCKSKEIKGGSRC